MSSFTLVARNTYCHDVEKSEPRVSRRVLLRVGAAAAAIELVRASGLMDSIDHVASAATRSMFDPGAKATANRTAQRGPLRQVSPFPPNPQHWRPGELVRRVDTPTPRMALTFDDGPSPYNTDPILRALAAAGVTATFFLIGVNVRAWPEIARRVRDAGHELGNHSVYHRPYRASALAAQIGPNQQIIHDATGVWPVVSRAPGLTRGNAILSACAQHNMYECHTDRDTSDARSPRWSAAALQRQFSSFLHSGWIGLYHDGDGPRPTRDAVPGMISFAKGRGYQISSATAMVNAGTPRSDFAVVGAPDSRSAVEESENAIDDQVFDCCTYDPRDGLLNRLEDPTVKAAERSRIVEVLADLDRFAKDESDGLVP